MAYHGEYQGVPILDSVATTPVLTKRRTNAENEFESEAVLSAGLQSATLEAPKKPKERSHQVESERELDPEYEHWPRHQSEPESVPNAQSKRQSRRKSKIQTEGSADGLSKRPSTSHEKSRRSSKNKRSSKYKSRSAVETVIPELPVLKASPISVVETSETTIPDESVDVIALVDGDGDVAAEHTIATSSLPDHSGLAVAYSEPTDVKESAELPTPPLSTEARSSTAVPLVEQRVVKPRPLTALSESPKPRARPQTVNLASEPAKIKSRPETAGPTVNVSTSKPKTRPETITQMTAIDGSKTRP
ncbi:hypothetical protein GGI05_007470, partial [Coemansia sp. RSA 2603]